MTDRGPMTPARKRRIHEEHDGRCQDCGDPVPICGQGVTYDHRVQLAFDGAEHDENVRPLCPRCDKAKTAADATARGKVRRLRKKALGTTREHSRIQNRGFRKDVRRRFDGSVVKR